jgi:hypothetical protein
MFKNWKDETRDFTENVSDDIDKVVKGQVERKMQES